MTLTRRMKNAKGRASGYGGCFRCGDTWNWKESHTTYFSKDGRWPQEGCFPLCEECWQGLTPEARLPYYDALVDFWVSEGPYSERGDVYRAALGQPAHYEEQRALIYAAVLTGG